MRKFKQRKNLLKEFIFNNGMKQASEQTVKSLLRSIVEPVIESNSDGVVLARLFDTKGLDGLLKRLDYSKASVYFYSDMGENTVNVSNNDIWESTEFVIVLASRYCAALVWDYSSSELTGYTNVSFYLNSRKIQDILKIVIDNSRIDFMPDVEPYSLERRENELMCDALHKVVDCLNDAVLENHITSEAGNIINEEKPVLSSNVRKIIHEIRNNLSVIDLHSKIIEKRIEKFDQEALAKILSAKAVIEKSSKSINMLLDDLKEGTEVNLEELSVQGLVEIALELCTPKMKEKNITSDIELKDFSVLADETKVLGVLLNIINNAIYALRKNGKLAVKIKENANSTVSIFVENDGSMIPVDVQKNIFDEGFTTKKDDGGSGLGLKISKTSMELMGGELNLIKSDVESTVFEIVMKKYERGGVC
ncbi:HAMP domain-containing histidine kinase [bacterium]|nr:HAMP domain-containing histidine kinase [bacterium]